MPVIFQNETVNQFVYIIHKRWTNHVAPCYDCATPCWTHTCYSGQHRTPKLTNSCLCCYCFSSNSRPVWGTGLGPRMHMFVCAVAFFTTNGWWKKPTLSTVGLVSETGQLKQWALKRVSNGLGQPGFHACYEQCSVEARFPRNETSLKDQVFDMKTGDGLCHFLPVPSQRASGIQ